MAWTYGDIATAVSAIVAVIALLRPELSNIFIRLRSRVDIHPAGRLEIGFNINGPTLAMIGTLRSKARDQFITDMSITVTRYRDNMNHQFDWMAFRPMSLLPSGEGAEIATGFMVRQDQPRSFSIVFNDRDTLGSLEKLHEALRVRALDYLRKKGVLLRDLDKNARKDIHNQFNSEENNLKSETWSKIGRIFYWEEGKYHLCLNVTKFDPAHSYIWQTDFHLSDKDTDILRSNVIVLVADAALEPDVSWQWSNVQYE